MADDLLHKLQVENRVLRAALKLKRLPDDMSRFEAVGVLKDSLVMRSRAELEELYISSVELITEALLERDNALLKSQPKTRIEDWVEEDEGDGR